MQCLNLFIFFIRDKHQFRKVLSWKIYPLLGQTGTHFNAAYSFIYGKTDNVGWTAVVRECDFVIIICMCKGRFLTLRYLECDRGLCLHQKIVVIALKADTICDNNKFLTTFDLIFLNIKLRLFQFFHTCNDFVIVLNHKFINLEYTRAFLSIKWKYWKLNFHNKSKDCKNAHPVAW